MLSHLDKLENHPIYYTRTQEEFQVLKAESSSDLKDGEIVKAGIYLLKNFKEELLKLPYLVDYSGNNELGKIYVKP